MAAVRDWQVAALLFLAPVLALAQAPAPEPPPPPPKFRLGDAATPTSYDVRFEIDPSKAEFAGEAKLAFRVNREARVIWLNATRLTIRDARVKQGERAVDVEVIEAGEDFVGLLAKTGTFAAGEATAVLSYRGPLEPLATRGLFRQQEAGEWYVVSQFEALNARRAMPCFDEPGWKTPWKVTIDAPAANVAVSNTPETRLADIEGRPGWKRHEFAPTKPLPSYLVALAVGPFDVVDGGRAGANGTPLRYLAPKGRGAETRYAREVTPRLVAILEDYFGSPYPFEKLDSVVIPQVVSFGAMENVGLITYDGRLLLATPPRETLAFKRTYVGIAAHEIAHMWFGNSVTLAWWDDIWLNESFATWAASKTRHAFNAEWESADYRARTRAQAISTDRLAASRRVRNPVNEREDLSGAFSSITYQKGAAVLEMFETWIGPDRFRDGVRAYLARHAYGSATSEDFFKAIGEASGRGPEAVPALRAFVDQPGVPLIDAALRCERASASLDLSQQRLRPKGSTAGPGEWMTPACFRLPNGRSQCEEVRNAPRSIALASCPEWVLGNIDGTGHYVVRYDDEATKRLVKAAPRLPVREAAAWISDTGLLAQSGLVSIESALDVADTAFAHASPVVRLVGVRLLDKLDDDWLDARQLAKKRSIIARRVQPLARQLGWEERARDDDATRDLRVTLLPFAARSPGGESLRAEARKLVLAWQREHGAIAAGMTQAVLDTGARYADRATYELFESLAHTARDPIERRQLLSALAKVREPALRERALALTLRKDAAGEAMSGRDAALFLRDVMEDDFNRMPAFEYARAHFGELVAKLPPNEAARFATHVHGLCTPAERETFVSFLKDRAAKFQGGKRRYDEALETIDLCIAARGR